MLTNKQRDLLGIKPIDKSDEIVDISVSSIEEIRVYIRENKIVKLIQSRDHLYKEIDYEIPLDDEKKIIGKKGSKAKPITFENIQNCKTKKMRLKVNRRYQKYELKTGTTHFKVLYFQSEQPTLESFQNKLTELYGSLEQWENLKMTALKKTKTRYLPKEGDIFSYPISENQYAFALIIGCFTRFRKNQMIPEENHYLKFMMWSPLIIRSFDFLSDQNHVDPQILKKYELLNPEIIMDANILRGNFPIVGKIDLQLDDIIFPMSFSFNGKNTTYAGYRSYIETQWEALNRLQEEITVHFDWGFGSVEMRASDFLDQQFTKEPDFQSIDGLGGCPSSFMENKLDSPNTIFSDRELQEIFNWLKIEPVLDFDEFNRKYGGITRQEYLNDI